MDNALRPFVPFVVASAALGAFALAGVVVDPAFDRAAAPALAAAAREAEDADVDVAALRGLWSRYADAGGRDDAPVAFYYFHDGGIGLYRYGKIAHNTTNSYHWRVVGDALELRWNKTGAVDRLGFRVDRSGPRPVLVVDGDPKNPGVAGSRYTFVPAPDAGAFAPDLPPGPSSVLSANHVTLDRVDNRLWIDLKKYATGGMGFSLYQLRSQGIDGRGTGWHHVGDFDDWSTEQLTYKATAGGGGDGALELLFALRGDRATTAVRLGRDRNPDGEERRTLTLAADPRDCGAPHVFVDAGPSFAQLGFGTVGAGADRGSKGAR